MTRPEILKPQPDFSLVLGGPLYQLFRRAHLEGDTLDLLRRRIVVITCVAWVPLLLLAAFEGRVLGLGAGTAIGISFLHDIEAHVRFLVALPILIGAEVIVHRRLRPAVLQFVERRLVPPDELAKFEQAIQATMRWRNSVLGEIALLVAVYTLGLWIWFNQIALGAASWYATPDAGRMQLTAAGYWYVLVSLPIFQFIFLRWYLRFLLWFGFLWRVSRLNLRLLPLHPDRCAGLGFLGGSTRAFGPILFAQGAMLAGLIASQIFYAGQNLMAFKLQIADFLAFFVAVILSPLLVFALPLSRAKRRGLSTYGLLASRYAESFDAKWLHGSAAPGDELLGSADIQSLADLGNSLAVVQEMRAVPFGMKDITHLAAAAAMPLLPLTLTILSPEELLDQLVKVVF